MRFVHLASAGGNNSVQPHSGFADILTQEMTKNRPNSSNSKKKHNNKANPVVTGSSNSNSGSNKNKPHVNAAPIDLDLGTASTSIAATGNQNSAGTEGLNSSIKLYPKGSRSSLRQASQALATSASTASLKKEGKKRELSVTCLPSGKKLTLHTQPSSHTDQNQILPLVFTSSKKPSAKRSLEIALDIPHLNMKNKKTKANISESASISSSNTISRKTKGKSRSKSTLSRDDYDKVPSTSHKKLSSGHPHAEPLSPSRALSKVQESHNLKSKVDLSSIEVPAAKADASFLSKESNILVKPSSVAKSDTAIEHNFNEHEEGYDHLNDSHYDEDDYDEDDDMEQDDYDCLDMDEDEAHRGQELSFLPSRFAALSGLMAGQSARLKIILVEIRQRDSAGTGNNLKLIIALQELAELLSVATEDTLSGSFQIDSFTRELVDVIAGTKNQRESRGKDTSREDLVVHVEAAVTPEFTDSDGEAMLLASRCLANLMEALPGSAHTVAVYGAIPVLCSKLVNIQFVDLAEEAVSTIHKLAEECPNRVVAAGGLSAILGYLDFFSLNVQRTALTTAAICCRALQSDHWPKVNEVLPTIRNFLAYSDQRLVEQACLCVIRICESFRSRRVILEQVMDKSLVSELQKLLIRGQGSPVLSEGTHTALLRVMSNACKISAPVSLILLNTQILDVIYVALTGVMPSEGTFGKLAVIPNNSISSTISHIKKDQLEEILNLVLVVVPPLSSEDNVRAVVRCCDACSDNQDADLDRFNLMNNNRDLMNPFCSQLVPVLVEVCSASVSKAIKLKSLEAIIRGVQFLEDINSLTIIPMASFISSLLSAQDCPDLVLAALRLALVLVHKNVERYSIEFGRQGVTHEIKKLSQTIEPQPSKVQDAAADSVDDQNTTTHQAIHKRSKQLLQKILTSGDDKMQSSLDLLSQINLQLSSPNLGSVETSKALNTIASMLCAESISSFELANSGLIDGLTLFLDENKDLANHAKRRTTFAQIFGGLALTTLVKRLHECLDRLENFRVLLQNENSGSNTPSLSRQMRLKLVPLPENDNKADTASSTSSISIIVSVHAIATFQALNDFLRPRIASSSHFGRSMALEALDLSAQSQKEPEAVSASNEPTLQSHSSQFDKNGKATSPVSALSAVPADDLAGDSDSINSGIDQSFKASLDLDESDIDDRSTVDVEVTDESSKVVPANKSSAEPSFSQSAAARDKSSRTASSSYAGALKAKPIDWHLQFFLGERPLKLEETVYGAIHREMDNGTEPSTSRSGSWSAVHIIHFQKKSGVPKIDEESPSTGGDMAHVLQIDSGVLQVSSLLKLLLELDPNRAANQRETLYINNKLSSKLKRQLEEPLIVASACLPTWTQSMVNQFPFLFPFESRYNFLESTSFGYARLVTKWQSAHSRALRASPQNSRDDTFGFLGRLPRQKVRISRDNVLESALKVFELYGKKSSILEVEYFDEAGTGLGPTLEFYSSVSTEFARKDLAMWRATGIDPSTYVNQRNGLFPAPLSAQELASNSGQRILKLFRTLGQFLAKGMLDSRIMNIHLSPIFIRMLLDIPVETNLETIKEIDVDLAQSLNSLESLARAEEAIPESSEKGNLEALSIEFVLPGYDIPLLPDGQDIILNPGNIGTYTQKVLELSLSSGIVQQVKAFQAGFNRIIKLSDLKCFSADELANLFGNATEDWSLACLSASVNADHGYNKDSLSYHNLLQYMASLDQDSRRTFLQFCTGSPKLPIGGFPALSPPLTVVRKNSELPNKSDDYLPSVMTCQNFLKLPDYSSAQVLEARFAKAVTEGADSFHLS